MNIYRPYRTTYFTCITCHTIVRVFDDGLFTFFIDSESVKRTKVNAYTTACTFLYINLFYHLASPMPGYIFPLSICLHVFNIVEFILCMYYILEQMVDCLSVYNPRPIILFVSLLSQFYELQKGNVLEKSENSR